MEELTSIPQGVASPAAPPAAPRQLLLAHLLQQCLLWPSRGRHHFYGQDGDKRGVEDQAAIGVMEGRLGRKKVQPIGQVVQTFQSKGRRVAHFPHEFARLSCETFPGLQRKRAAVLVPPATFDLC